MVKVRDITAGLERAVRDFEDATERVVQRASTYVDASIAKVQNKGQGTPAWLELAAEIEPHEPPFGIEPTLEGYLRIPSGRLFFVNESRIELAKVDPGRAAVFVGRRPASIAYTLLRLGPERVVRWAELVKFPRKSAVILADRDVTRAPASADDLKAALSAQDVVRKQVALVDFGAACNRLVLVGSIPTAAYAGHDAHGAVAAIAFDYPL